MSGWDKSGTGDHNPDQQGGPRANWNPFTDGPMPEWTKPGYVDNRPLVPSPDHSKTLTMEELRAKRKAEAAAKGSDETSEQTEQTEAGPKTTDQASDVPEVADAGPDRETEATDKDPDAEKIGRLESTIKRFEGLFHRQNDVIDSQQKQIDGLGSVLGRQEKTIEKLEAKNDKLEARNDSLQNENNRLRAELAQSNDNPSEGQSSVRASADVTPVKDRDAHRTELDAPWYKKFPSEKLVGIGTTVAGLGQAIAAGTHHMSSAESGIITAGIGVGVSVLGYAREKYTERKARNADRPEN